MGLLKELIWKHHFLTMWQYITYVNVWTSFNTILNEKGLNWFSVNDYNVIKFNGTGAVCTIKLIQIVRPTNMTIDRVKKR
jgi:hypothetical protein